MPEPLDDQATISAWGPPATRYAYKASLIGAAHRFELTEQGLSWLIAGRSGMWPYADIATVRLSYRPVSMQSRRFRADIGNADGARIVILSTSWQTAALMAPQDRDYRAFVDAAARADGERREQGDAGRRPQAARLCRGACLLTLVGDRDGRTFRFAPIATGEWAGALFLVGFAALFAWQVGGFIRRNRPLAYTFDHLPQALLP